MTQDPGGPDPGGPDPGGPDPSGPDPSGPDPDGPDTDGPATGGPAPARSTLTPRTSTLVVAGLLLVGLVTLAGILPAPYAVEGPGPTENVLGSYGDVPVVRIAGHRTYPTAGELRLTTVNSTSCGTQLSLWAALAGWLDRQRDIVPRQLVCPAGSTPGQVEQRNAEAMSRSQESAKVAALRQVGITVPQVVVVEAVQEGAPALGRLRAGDVMRSVDGTAVTTPQQVAGLVRAHAAGEVVRFGVERNGRELTVGVRGERRTVQGTPATVVGIVPAVGYDFPFDVEVTLGEQIGGPSAGLVFALGIVDKLTPGQLLAGRSVAGTGEIAADGTVGPIGGIQQKVYGAQAAGATVFLAPAANCADLAGVQSDLRIVRVETLASAVAALRALDAGTGDVPSCS